MMRTVAVIPVRMGSERLPGKVMASIEGQPLLGHLLDRVQRCTALDDVVVATSTNSENDCIETYCNQQQISVFRGDEEVPTFNYHHSDPLVDGDPEGRQQMQYF